MNRRLNNSSISPSSSVDSMNRRRQSASKNKQPTKSRDDVQVFTSLPPSVEGDIKFNLKLEITKINLIINSQKPTSGAKLNKKSDIKAPELATNLIAQCVWWGEENTRGSIFRPRVLVNGDSINSERKIQTTARYVVRSGIRQFTAYLNGKLF